MTDNAEIERLISVVQKEWIVCGLGIGTLYGDFALEVAKRAVAAENKECAELCEELETDMGHGIAQRCAEKIRARAK